MYNIYFIFVLILLIIVCSYQSDAQFSQTEPKLISVIPINSTALTVNWQFANSSYDRSDFIRIYIVFYQFYYTYKQTYATNNYTFTSSNKTITNLTKNFEFVNAYYYVCLSSNSSITNISQNLLVLNQCLLTRTCLRSNSACPGPSTVLIQSTNITSNSFQISFLWPNDLPLTPISFSAQLINNGQRGTAVTSSQNTSFTNQLYQFTGLQSNTNYQVNTTFNYSFFNVTTTNTSLVTVKTSSAGKLDISNHFLLVLLILYFFFELK